MASLIADWLLAFATKPVVNLNKNTLQQATKMLKGITIPGVFKNSFIIIRNRFIFSYSLKKMGYRKFYTPGVITKQLP